MAPRVSPVGQSDQEKLQKDGVEVFCKLNENGQDGPGPRLRRGRNGSGPRFKQL